MTTTVFEGVSPLIQEESVVLKPKGGSCTFVELKKSGYVLLRLFQADWESMLALGEEHPPIGVGAWKGIRETNGL